jgi:hypothetical protein
MTLSQEAEHRPAMISSRASAQRRLARQLGAAHRSRSSPSPATWQRSAARWRGDRAGEARSARRSARAQRPHVALRDREEQRLEQVRVAERGALAAPELRAQPRATMTTSVRSSCDALGGGAVARGSVVLHATRPSAGRCSAPRA